MTGEGPQYSFIIPTRGAGARLESTLAALEAASRADEVEAVVVFDGLGLLRRIEVAGLPVQVLEQPSGGPARARNRGAAAARGRWIIFLDDDCSLHPEFLREFGSASADARRTMFGGTPMLPPGSSVWSEASHLVTESFLESQRRNGRHGFLPSQCFAVRASDWREMGGFDESFAAAAGEDREFCLRSVARGFELTRLDGARYWHDHPLSMLAFLRKHSEYGAASARLGPRGQRSPGPFLLSAMRRLVAKTAPARIVPVAFAFALSQFAAVLGGLRARPAKASQ